EARIEAAYRVLLSVDEVGGVVHDPVWVVGDGGPGRVGRRSGVDGRAPVVTVAAEEGRGRLLVGVIAQGHQLQGCAPLAQDLERAAALIQLHVRWRGAGVLDGHRRGGGIAEHLRRRDRRRGDRQLAGSEPEVRQGRTVRGHVHRLAGVLVPALGGGELVRPGQRGEQPVVAVPDRGVGAQRRGGLVRRVVGAGYRGAVEPLAGVGVGNLANDEATWGWVTGLVLNGDV